MTMKPVSHNARDLGYMHKVKGWYREQILYLDSVCLTNDILIEALQFLGAFPE